MTDVLAVLEQLGIEVSRETHGRNGLHYEARCPHHYGGTQEDSSPSWAINAETGQHLCYACGFKGSLAWLIHIIAGTPLEEAERDLRPEVSTFWRGAASIANLSKRFSKPPAKHYSRGRYLSYDEVPADRLESRNITAQAADAFGVRWDHKRDAWILPIRDPEEPDLLLGVQVKGEGSDRLFRNVPIGVEKSSTLFGIEHLLMARYEEPIEVVVVLVESPLDAVRLWDLGILAVASFGAVVSDEQMRLIVAYADRLVIALDNPAIDEAGRKSLNALLGRNQWGYRNRRGYDWSKRILTQVFDYGTSKAKDPGDMGDEAIKRGIRRATPAVKYAA